MADTTDAATVEAERGEAAWTRLCELADRLPDRWLASYNSGDGHNGYGWTPR